MVLLKLARDTVFERSMTQMKSEAEAIGVGEAFKSIGRELKIVKWSFSLLAFPMYGLAWYFWIRDHSVRDAYVLFGMFIALFLALTTWESWIYLKFVCKFQLTLKPALFHTVAIATFNCTLLAFLFILVCK